MLKNVCPAATALVALAASTVAQTGTQVVLPAHNNVYNGFSRGFSFTAGSDFFIQDFELPLDAQQTGDTAGVVCFVNGTEVFRSVGNTSAIITPGGGPLQILTGDLVNVTGNWSPATTGNFTAHNSYATGGGTYSTPIEGIATTLFRAGVQYDIGDPAYNTATVFDSNTGSFGRIWIYTTPPAGLFPSFTATPTTGSSPLQVQFTDTTFTSDPGGVLTWEWDLDGDGVVDDTQQNPMFVYGACGTYDVTLTVTDATHGQVSTTVVGAVVVDPIVADFTYSNIAPGIWQFDDASSPAASTFGWDWDGDGVIDDTGNPAIYVDPTPSLLNLPNLTYTAGGPGGCSTDTIVKSIFEADPNVSEVVGETAGGNGTVATPAVGTYFDIEVLNPEGMNIIGLTTGFYGYSGAFDAQVYITNGTHVGKEGNADAWTLVGVGSGTATGSGVLATPEFVGMELPAPFYLPQGSYGVALYHVDQGGGSAQVSYTNGPAASPYGNADMTIHPNGVGCSSTSLLGGCAFSPRLWNGSFYYELCSVSGSAAAGSYASGCANSAAVVPNLSVSSLPVLGATYELDVNTGLASPAAVLMVLGFSKDIYNGLPLPLDLGVIGAPGCELAASAQATPVLIAQPGSGNIYSLAVPNNPALQCGVIYAQGAVLDIPANSLGFVFSNAIAGQMGN